MMKFVKSLPVTTGFPFGSFGFIEEEEDEERETLT